MSKAERKEREREMRRNEIIDAAEKLFFSRGYENVTMDDIAKELEMSRATLYLSFLNKDDIYAAIAIRGARILLQMFRDSYAKGATGMEIVRSLGDTFREFYEKYPGYAVAYNHPVMFGRADSPATDELRKVKADIFLVSVDAICAGIKDGSIRDDVHPAMTTLFMLFATTNVLSLAPVVQVYTKKYGFTQDELYDYIQRLMMRSIDNVQTGKKRQP